MFSAELNKFRSPTNFDFSLSFNKTLPTERLDKLMQEVADIQNSIEWDDPDRITRRHFYDPGVYKVTVFDTATKELVGYALVVPKPGNKWYVSQLAVMKSHQRKLLGYRIMRKILQKAEKHRIVKIKLHTEDSLLQFYSKLRLPPHQISTKSDG